MDVDAGKKFRSVLVLYTGGTIGMKRNSEGVFAPAEHVFTDKIRSLPEFNNEILTKTLRKSDQYLSFNEEHPNLNPHGYSITYLIKEYEPLLDSSNMSVDDWKRIAKDIQDEYYNFDSFVILHGTDTMSYTASALSFMLEDLCKSVVITGSQTSIFEPFSDAVANFRSALLYSALHIIPEVCVCFGGKLYRGNRSMKTSSTLLDAFSSPNYSSMGNMRTGHCDFKFYNPQNALNISSLTVHTKMNPNVGIVYVFPTLTNIMLAGMIGTKPRLEGIVLQSYGIGNMPTANQDLMEVLKKAVDDGVIIVNITQCGQGTVDTTYKTGQDLEKIGILPGYDMTTSAALAKLSYVLGMDNLSLEEKKKLMVTSIRGEMTKP